MAQLGRGRSHDPARVTAPLGVLLAETPEELADHLDREAEYFRQAAAQYRALAAAKDAASSGTVRRPSRCGSPPRPAPGSPRRSPTGRAGPRKRRSGRGVTRRYRRRTGIQKTPRRAFCIPRHLEGHRVTAPGERPEELPGRLRPPVSGPGRPQRPHGSEAGAAAATATRRRGVGDRPDRLGRPSAGCQDAVRRTRSRSSRPRAPGARRT